MFVLRKIAYFFRESIDAKQSLDRIGQKHNNALVGAYQEKISKGQEEGINAEAEAV